jgi:lysophospholipase L1-like esterase
MQGSSSTASGASGPIDGWKRVLAILLIGALGGFAAGQFAAGISVLRGFFPFGLLQDTGSGLARRLASRKGLEPNGEHPDRREQFEMFVRPVEVVMIGDSITEAGMWEDMFPGIAIANRGIGADRTDDVMLRMPPILELRARKAFVMLGINDLSADRGVDTVFADYSAILSALRAQGVEVVVQSTLQCNLELRRRCAAQLPLIEGLNSRLEALAASDGLVFVDLNAVLTAPGEGLRRQFTRDGVHLNGAGYRRWADTIRPMILKVAAEAVDSEVSGQSGQPAVDVR